MHWVPERSTQAGTGPEQGLKTGRKTLFMVLKKGEYNTSFGSWKMGASAFLLYLNRIMNIMNRIMLRGSLLSGGNLWKKNWRKFSVF